MADAVVMTYGSPLGQSPASVAALIGSMGASSTARVRFNVQGMDSITVHAKGAVTATANMDLFPMGPDAGKDWEEDLGTAMTTGGPSQVPLVNNSETDIEYTLKGERYVDLVITTGAASAFNPTTAGSFVFVFARP